MLFGEETNPLYVRALMTHGEHNRRWNYGMEILQQDVAQGYWNKPSYLISLLVRELAKPPGHRVEWLMYVRNQSSDAPRSELLLHHSCSAHSTTAAFVLIFKFRNRWVDADLILLNPSVPLETFLPPENGPQIHFLGNRDHKGLNTGTFFLRVHPWSIRMLEKATALPMYLPDIDLDTSVDQTAMSIVMSEAEFSQNHEVLFQPRVWYNSYQFHHAFEGKDGDLLVHFPGLEEERWDFMAKWLDEVEKTTGKHDLAIDNTRYPSETKKFWTLVDDARNLLTKAHQQMDAAQTGSGMQGVMHAREELLSVIIGTKYPVPPGSDDFELYEKKIKELKDAMGE